VILPTFEWVDADGRFKLAIMPRPDLRRLEEHLRELKEKGADVLVSMMQPEEAEALGLGEERALCEKVGITFYNHPVPDHQTPTDRAATEAFARSLIAELERGRGVVIHCFAGIGRSATMAATVMILAGFSLEQSCLRLSNARNLRVPETISQIEWLMHVNRAPGGEDSPE
jgi:protein-tyrosine phosphatase